MFFSHKDRYPFLFGLTVQEKRFINTGRLYPEVYGRKVFFLPDLSR